MEVSSLIAHMDLPQLWCLESGTSISPSSQPPVLSTVRSFGYLQEGAQIKEEEVDHAFKEPALSLS